MDNNVLTTSADDLYELVKVRKKISIEEAAKILRMSVKSVHSLVDFFVDEKVFGIEYKFTTPYVYISREKPKKEIIIEPTFAKEIYTKDEFFSQAEKRKLDFEKINELWSKYIGENIDYIKDEFYRKAKERNLKGEIIDKLWEKYMTYLR